MSKLHRCNDLWFNVIPSVNKILICEIWDIEDISIIFLLFSINSRENINKKYTKIISTSNPF